jgi:hypothetical protein
MSEKSEDSRDKEKEDKEKADETKDAPEQSEVEPAQAENKSADAPDKPLEKMTVKELREVAKELPGMTGVHAMKKDELIAGIKKAKGIKDESVKKVDASIAELKKKIKILKGERQAALEAKDKKKAKILRRRISRLKQKTRRVAA